MRLASPDLVDWFIVEEVEWSVTWRCMERRVQAVLALPPHRHVVFEAEGDQPSNRVRVGPSFGCHGARRRLG